ncbi:MAG: class C sortase [Coprococcus sp.]
MRKTFGKVISVLVIVLGSVLLFYPFISEYLFEHRVDSEIHTYQDILDDISNELYDQMLKGAGDYNEALTQSQVRLTDPFIEQEEEMGDICYEDILALDGTGIMGYIEIPVISVYLPIYHGTAASTLENGIGHLEGTSFPVGGKNTHAVLTGHTGINKSKMFTDLTELEEGDLFFVHVLEDTLAYQIYEINIVLPEDTSKLLIRNGEDLVTLVTCTPYSINTHRLLVHGRRIDYSEKIYEKMAEIGNRNTDSQWMRSYKKAILMGLLITAALFIIMLLLSKIKKKLKGK